MGAWLLAEVAELAISSDVMLAAGSAAVVGGQAAGAVVHRHGIYPHAGWSNSLVSAAHDAWRFRIWDAGASRRAVSHDATRSVGVRHAQRTTAIVCAAILGAVGLTLSTAISPAPVTVTVAVGIALLLIMPATVVMTAARSTDARSVLSRRGPHLMVTGVVQEACQVAAILIPVLVVAHTAGVTGLSLADVTAVALVTRVVVLATPVAGIGAADVTLVAGLSWIGTPLPAAVAALLVWRAGTLLAVVAAAGIAARFAPVVAEQEGPSVDGAGRAVHRAVFSVLAVLPGTMRDSARRWVFDTLFSVSADPWGYQQLPYERRKQQHLLNAIDPTARVVLEVGCADGHNLLAVAQHLPGATVVGTDVSARALRIASDRTAHLDRVHVVDATDDEAVRRAVHGPVDYVVLAEVLYYLGGDRGMDMALTSVRSLMGPETRVVMVHGSADACALHARAANALGRDIVSGVCVLDADRPFEIVVAAAAAGGHSVPVRTATLTEPASPGRLRRRLRPERHRLRHLLVAALGALAVSAAFPPFGWWWSAPLGVALIVASAHGASVRVSAVAGAVAGAVFAGTSLVWLTSVGPDAYLAVTAVFAAWWAAMLTGIRLTMGLRAWPLLVPAVWVGQEWARSQWPLGGFPWARLAYVSVDSPFAALVPHLGVYGLTYVIAAIGSLLAAAIVGSHRRGALIAAGLAAAAVVASGAAVAQAAPAGSAQPAVQVAVVQGGGQPGAGEQQARAVLAAHVGETRLLAAGTVERPAFVLWPESATDIDPLIDTQARAQIDAAVADIGVPVVVGAVTAAPDQPQLARNQSISWMPLTGPGVAYTKRQLVPFGEYVPARGLLERLTSRFTQIPRDFVSGTDSPVIDVGAVRLGMLICYEVAFDDRVTDAVSAGATVLAAPSNNATYAGTTQPAQQLAITRFRALETARATLLASTTGVSAIIDSSGRVLTSIQDGASGSRVADVTPSTRITTAVRWGGGIGVALTVIAVVAVIVGARAHRRAARRSEAVIPST